MFAFLNNIINIQYRNTLKIDPNYPAAYGDIQQKSAFSRFIKIHEKEKSNFIKYKDTKSELCPLKKNSPSPLFINSTIINATTDDEQNIKNQIFIEKIQQLKEALQKVITFILTDIPQDLAPILHWFIELEKIMPITWLGPCVMFVPLLCTLNAMLMPLWYRLQKKKAKYAKFNDMIWTIRLLNSGIFLCILGMFLLGINTLNRTRIFEILFFINSPQTTLILVFILFFFVLGFIALRFVVIQYRLKCISLILTLYWVLAFTLLLVLVANAIFLILLIVAVSLALITATLTDIDYLPDTTKALVNASSNVNTTSQVQSKTLFSTNLIKLKVKYKTIIQIKKKKKKLYISKISSNRRLFSTQQTTPINSKKLIIKVDTVLQTLHQRNSKKLLAGLWYFLLNITATFSLSLFIIYSIFFYNTLSFHTLTILLNTDLYNSTYILIVFLIIAFCYKLGVAPFHMWMPALFSGLSYGFLFFFSVPIKLVFLVILYKLLTTVFFNYFSFWSPILLFLGLLSIMLGSVGLFGQQEIKKFLAFSTLNHFGFILVALSCGTILGQKAFIIYTLTYFITTTAFFLVLNSFKNTKTNQPITSFVELTTIVFTNNVVHFFLTIIFLSFLGMPPFLGFWGKAFVISAVLHYYNFYGFIFVGLIIIFSVIAASSYLIVIKNLFILTKPNLYLNTVNTFPILNLRFFFCFGIVLSCGGFCFLTNYVQLRLDDLLFGFSQLTNETFIVLNQLCLIENVFYNDKIFFSKLTALNFSDFGKIESRFFSQLILVYFDIINWWFFLIGDSTDFLVFFEKHEFFVLLLFDLMEFDKTQPGTAYFMLDLYLQHKKMLILNEDIPTNEQELFHCLILYELILKQKLSNLFN